MGKKDKKREKDPDLLPPLSEKDAAEFCARLGRYPELDPSVEGVEFEDEDVDAEPVRRCESRVCIDAQSADLDRYLRLPQRERDAEKMKLVERAENYLDAQKEMSSEEDEDVDSEDVDDEDEEDSDDSFEFDPTHPQSRAWQRDWFRQIKDIHFEVFGKYYTKKEIKEEEPDTVDLPPDETKIKLEEPWQQTDYGQKVPKIEVVSPNPSYQAEQPIDELKTVKIEDSINFELKVPKLEIKLSPPPQIDDYFQDDSAIGTMDSMEDYDVSGGNLAGIPGNSIEEPSTDNKNNYSYDWDDSLLDITLEEETENSPQPSPEQFSFDDFFSGSFSSQEMKPAEMMLRSVKDEPEDIVEIKEEQTTVIQDTVAMVATVPLPSTTVIQDTVPFETTVPLPATTVIQDTVATEATVTQKDAVASTSLPAATVPLPATTVIQDTVPPPKRKQVRFNLNPMGPTATVPLGTTVIPVLKPSMLSIVRLAVTVPTTVPSTVTTGTTVPPTVLKPTTIIPNTVPPETTVSLGTAVPLAATVPLRSTVPATVIPHMVPSETTVMPKTTVPPTVFKPTTVPPTATVPKPSTVRATVFPSIILKPSTVPSTVPLRAIVPATVPQSATVILETTVSPTVLEPSTVPQPATVSDTVTLRARVLKPSSAPSAVPLRTTELSTVPLTRKTRQGPPPPKMRKTTVPAKATPSTTTVTGRQYETRSAAKTRKSPRRRV